MAFVYKPDSNMINGYIWIYEKWFKIARDGWIELLKQYKLERYVDAIDKAHVSFYALREEFISS